MKEGSPAKEGSSWIAKTLVDHSLNNDQHAVVIPLHGSLPLTVCNQLWSLHQANFKIVLVDNGADADILGRVSRGSWPECTLVRNSNLGGIAGGFNRGIETALLLDASWVTLLDQDSELRPDQIQQLRHGWTEASCLMRSEMILVGPRIRDRRRAISTDQQTHATIQPTRLLISSGTTFRAKHWDSMGPLLEWLFIDFVDHEWCFRLQHNGYRLFEVSSVLLLQEFGIRHPNVLCHLLGMQLYSSTRHYYSIRNLRWLIKKPYIPLDLRIKEVVKMVFKIPLWLLFEPHRQKNLWAILNGLRAPLANGQ